MSGERLAVGIDIGTSGVRAVAMSPSFAVEAEAAVATPAGTDIRDAENWWRGVEGALDGLFAQVEPRRVAALAVDGTSGTMLPVDGDGRPLAAPLMYNDPVEDTGIRTAIATCAPTTSAAHGATSGLAKAMRFARLPGVARVLHQADWIAGRFSGRFDRSDENNALKTGYDPVARAWPDWILRTGMRRELLPEVVAPGTVFGTITRQAAARFGLGADTVILAGTTDGCASFLATGAREPGDGVTALGSSLTLKLLSNAPLFAPQYGIYSHRLGAMWLAGGASNSGGKVLLQHFTAPQMAAMTEKLDPERETGLDYYPLPAKGERFPIVDPELEPRLEPRPASDETFFQGLLEGVAAVEALGYRRLAELGAPKLASMRSVGGGAKNPAWTRIRQRKLGVPFLAPLSEEAAAGAARLALEGAREAGLL